MQSSLVTAGHSPMFRW